MAGPLRTSARELGTSFLCCASCYIAIFFRPLPCCCSRNWKVARPMLRAQDRREKEAPKRIERKKTPLLAIAGAAAATGPSRYLIRSGGIYVCIYTGQSLSSSSIFSQPAHLVLSSFLMTFPPPFADPQFSRPKKEVTTVCFCRINAASFDNIRRGGTRKKKKKLIRPYRHPHSSWNRKCREK